MKKAMVALLSLCCLVVFSSVSMAAPVKSVKGEVSGSRNTMTEDARKKSVTKNIKRSSEHGSVRGSINGGGDMI